MSETLEEYRRKLQTEVDAFALEGQPHLRAGQLHAFHFGRFLGRMENAQESFWLRVRWLLLGAAVGVALAAGCLQIFLAARLLPFTR
jgi:hypothetical protein